MLINMMPVPCSYLKLYVDPILNICVWKYIYMSTGKNWLNSM